MQLINKTCLEIFCILFMKLHITGCNGTHQVSTTIKMGLYICMRVIDEENSMHQSPVCSNISCNMLYITTKMYFQTVVWT